MKMIGNWLDKPVTWRNYLSMFGVTMGIYTIGVSIYYAVIFWEEILDKLDNLTNLVKSKLNRDQD